MSTVSDVSAAGLDLTQKGGKLQENATSLDKDAFLKLLGAQMKYQDPMNPTDQTAQLAQLAQFSSVEQMTNLVKQSKESYASQRSTEAISLIGKDVTYLDENEQEQSGKVEKVTYKDGEPTLTVNGKADVSPGRVTGVA